MDRRLSKHFLTHFRNHRQMLFLSGPRQVGKTTLAKDLRDRFASGHYFNWDDPTHRELILKGPGEVALRAGLEKLRADLPLCVFDELHKYRHWRGFLKGFFDLHESHARTLVTGSASLATFRRGGDSLMGRYFPYTLHPVSVAELARPKTSSSLIHSPARIDGDEWDSLWRFGGFPEPFLKAERNFHNQWSGLRDNQLFREDLRDLTRIQELGQVETLAQLLRQRAGQLTSYASLAKTVRTSLDTARRWTATLEALYYCFSIRPWHHNVARALRKEPKYFLWDWSQVESPGARAENLVACALLKAVHWWTESGEGEFALHFVRDKQKREVDFLVAKDRRPWFLVEVKRGGNPRLSDSLRYFQKQTGATHAFQVVMDAEYVARDCFERSDPVLVPGRTFLSQLV